jgi:hypothetical protein
LGRNLFGAICLCFAALQATQRSVSEPMLLHLHAKFEIGCVLEALIVESTTSGVLPEGIGLQFAKRRHVVATKPY